MATSLKTTLFRAGFRQQALCCQGLLCAILLLIISSALNPSVANAAAATKTAITTATAKTAAYEQINDKALKAFLSQSLNQQAQADGSSFDRYDAEVWLERTLAVMQRFKLEQAEALAVLQAVYREARANQLPTDLVLAVIEIESHFNRYAVSRVGAQGLMQVMPFWKDEIGRSSDNLTDIDTNIRYGCTILAYYLDMAKQRWPEALARYNGSYGRTTYSEKVLLAWERRWQGTGMRW